MCASKATAATAVVINILRPRHGVAVESPRRARAPDHLAVYCGQQTEAPAVNRCSERGDYSEEWLRE
jgi:hypothetical protein